MRVLYLVETGHTVRNMTEVTQFSREPLHRVYNQLTWGSFGNLRLINKTDRNELHFLRFPATHWDHKLDGNRKWKIKILKLQRTKDWENENWEQKENEKIKILKRPYCALVIFVSYTECIKNLQINNFKGYICFVDYIYLKRTKTKRENLNIIIHNTIANEITISLKRFSILWYVWYI